MMTNSKRVFPQAPAFDSWEAESIYYAQIIQKNRQIKDHSRDSHRTGLLQQCANAGLFISVAQRILPGNQR